MLLVQDLGASLECYREPFGAELIEQGHASDGEGATAVDEAALEVATKRVYRFDRVVYEAAGLVDAIPVGFLDFGHVVDAVERAWAGLPHIVELVAVPRTFGALRIAFFADQPASASN